MGGGRHRRLGGGQPGACGVKGQRHHGVDGGAQHLGHLALGHIHEGNFTPDELPAHRGWGHSSWEQAVEVAERAGVQRLAITHHDPDHDDAFLREVERQVQARLPTAFLAREGMELEL